MNPRIVIVQRSDSFQQLWDQLSATLNADFVFSPCVSTLDGVEDACAVIVCAAGVEKEALAELHTLERSQRLQTAVVGTETDYRKVAPLLRAGAADFFSLPSDLAVMHEWLERRVEGAMSGDAVGRLLDSERSRFDFSRIVGESSCLLDALERATKIIPHGQATILLTGETGTGKDLLAHAIHYNSPRAARPFVEVNCTALPANLLEAELFGYEKGAFTDARASKPGLFEAANHGTLFLDEIGDLPLELQAKLLKVLERKSIRRLGSVAETAVDVRIVAATHVNLPAAVREGRFRRDLLFRLNVFPIELPPLRERGADVIVLAEHFLSRFATEYGLPKPEITSDILESLLAYRWPGNVRELRNSMERVLLIGRAGVHHSDLFLQESESGRGPDPLPFPASLEEIGRTAARLAVDHCGGNKSAAARVLGVSRRHLYTLLG